MRVARRDRERGILGCARVRVRSGAEGDDPVCTPSAAGPRRALQAMLGGRAGESQGSRSTWPTQDHPSHPGLPAGGVSTLASLKRD